MNSFAQRSWSLNGYVKYMQTNFVGKDTSGLNLLTDNLIHNRLNFSWYANDYIEVRAEMRNRVFYGEYTKLIPNYGDLLEADNGYFDMRWTLVDQQHLLFHSTIDRAFVAYQKGKHNLHLGRQRINWGLNTVYTPNDVFNAFNYFDFDYEERPGVDAFRYEYYVSDLASIDIAIAPGRNDTSWVGAAKYGFNLGSYDLQVIGSWYKTDLMAGLGWAGNLGNAGLKGEASYFVPRRENNYEDAVFTGTFTLDYTFSGGWYVSAALLYVSDGIIDPVVSSTGLSLISGDISVKRLMPTKYTSMVMANKSLNPATNISLLTMYAPGTNMIILFPTLTYSIKENWDVDVVAQAAFMEINEEMQHGGSAVFLRLKRSF
ncbi:MAG: hypothetical protein JXQ87_18580 [Bacteroidia bacterium]